MRGRLVKPLGPIDLPVCNATVEIYEVDIIRIVATLPDDILERIRELAVTRIPLPIPPPQLPAGTVAVTYQPYHRNGQATYSFNIRRGATDPASGGLPESGVVPTGGATFTHSQTVRSLLEGCPAAGFAAILYVDSLATNGTTDELGYDAQDIYAFALAPASALS